jgi:cardiolipin synthase
MALVETDKVVNAAEFSRVATKGLDDYVKQHGGKSDAFVFVTAGGPRPARYILFDIGKPKTVLVYLPTPGEAAGEPSTMGTFAEYFRAGIIDGTLISLLKNPVSTTGRLINVVYQWIANWGTRFLPGSAPELAPISDGTPMDLAAFEARLDEKDKIPKRQRGSIRLLINGPEYFPLLEQRIREATSTIHIIMCIFDTDDFAIHIADMLRERSREIETQVIVDRFSSLGSGRAAPGVPMPVNYVPPPSIQTYLRTDSKVEVRNFLNPWATAEHSKVLLFDRKYAHIGGMNIGREYRSAWHDMMVEMEGPIVGWYEKRFQFAWSHASTFGDFATAWDSLSGKEPPGYAGAAERADYVDLRPLRTETFDTEIMNAVRHAIQSARRYIWIENPYIFENAIVNDLVDARRRGVDVRVIVPSEADADAFDSSNKTTSNVLVANGIRVYIYPGMTHVKAILVDGWACVGSANFNKLSLRTNIETNVATSDPKFVAELRERLFEVDFEKSREVTEAYEVSWSDWLSSFILDDF